MRVVEDVLDQQPNHTSLKVVKPLRGPEIMVDAERDDRKPGVEAGFSGNAQFILAPYRSSRSIGAR
jgi:hypothetical protein